jgi:hypothetical protein
MRALIKIARQCNQKLILIIDWNNTNSVLMGIKAY